MTFKQLEQFLKTEKWRAGTKQNSDMCGKYARCVFCDRYCDYPCARAFDALVRSRKEGKAALAPWQYPEPEVKEKFGTVYASEEAVGSVAKISIDPEDLFFFSLGGRSGEAFAVAYFGNETDTARTSYNDAVYASLPAGAEDGESAIRETPEPRRTEREVQSRYGTSKEKTRVLVIRKRTKS